MLAAQRVARRHRVGVVLTEFESHAGSIRYWIDDTAHHQPLAEMAVAATELALALGRGDRAEQPRLELATTLTVRESTAPPRHQARNLRSAVGVPIGGL